MRKKAKKQNIRHQREARLPSALQGECYLELSAMYPLGNQMLRPGLTVEAFTSMTVSLAVLQAAL
jgi:hypothetical protein